MIWQPQRPSCYDLSVFRLWRRVAPGSHIIGRARDLLAAPIEAIAEGNAAMTWRADFSVGAGLYPNNAAGRTPNNAA